jgi:hypothetical protein
VGRQRERVDRQRRQVQRPGREGLHRVGVEGDRALPQVGADGDEVVDGAEFVVGGHDTDQRGVLSHRGEHALGVHGAVRSRWDDGDVEPLVIGDPADGVGHGRVLDRRGDEVSGAPPR